MQKFAASPSGMICAPAEPARQCGGNRANSGSPSGCASPLETSSEPESTAAASSRSILGISFSAPGAYSFPPGSRKSACASTSQKTFLCCPIGADEIPAPLFYRKAAHPLAHLFKRPLQRLAVIDRIVHLAVDLPEALRQPRQPVRAAIAQHADGLRRRHGPPLAHHGNQQRFSAVRRFALERDAVALE